MTDLLITGDNSCVAGVARAYKYPLSKGFLFSGLPRVAPYCVPVVSKWCRASDANVPAEPRHRYAFSGRVVLLLYGLFPAPDGKDSSERLGGYPPNLLSCRPGRTRWAPPQLGKTGGYYSVVQRYWTCAVSVVKHERIGRPEASHAVLDDKHRRGALTSLTTDS